MLGSVAWITGSGYVNAGLAILRGILFARILGPQSYGAWGFLSTIQRLAANADLGVGHVVERDIPGVLGRGEQQEADTLGALARLWVPVASCLVGIVLAVLWPLLRWPVAPGWGVLVPLFLVGMGLFSAAQTVERGFLAFRRLAVLTSLAGLAGLMAGVVASSVLGVSGLAATQAVVYGVAGLAAVAMRRSPAKVVEVIRTWRRAVVEGWRLLLPNLALQAFVAVDMLVVSWALSAEAVGQYSVALLGSTMVAGVIASGIGTVAGQHLYRETAASESGVPRSAMVWGPAAALATVLAPAAAAAALLTPTVLDVVLPDYAAAAGPAAVLLAATYFLDSQFGFSTTFIAAGRPLATVPLYAALIAVNVGIDVVLLRLGLGLLGIAIGSLIVNVCFQVAHGVLVGTLVSGGRRQAAQGACTLAAGALPVAAALTVLGYPSVALGFAGAGLVGWAGLIVVTVHWLGSRITPPRSVRRGDGSSES